MANKFDEAMNVLAAEAESERLWKPYAEWCRTRARRLTEQAEIVAGQFSEAARQWPFDERKRFAVWLVNSTGVAIERCGGQRYQSRFSYSGPDMFESRTVVDVVVRPTLAEWRNTEPSNPEPCIWIALYDEDLWSYLQEARRLNPMHGPTCEAVVVQNIRGIEYNQHELPSGYLDDPADDLTTLTEAEVLLAHAVDPRVRQTLSQKIDTLRATAEDWISLREQLKGLDWESRDSIWKARPPRVRKSSFPTTPPSPPHISKPRAPCYKDP